MADPKKFYKRITSDCLTDWQYIGQGGFSTVRRARHKDWGIDVAVKILHRNVSCTQEELLKEARAMHQARFTRVLHLFGLFVNEGQADVTGLEAPCLGLVMEFMENGSVSTLQSKVPSVPWALRFRILHQVALAMNFLHGLHPPLLHLDLKPSNVLLNGELNVQVADFGLSKFKESTRPSASGNSEEDECGGTLEYMPPEAFNSGVNYKPTPATDVYSYGILMWTVLTGDIPYKGMNRKLLSSIIKQTIPEGQRPSTDDLKKKVPEVEKLEDMLSLMERCWQNDAAQRPSFQVCRQETEDTFSCYSAQIPAAIHEVQYILMGRSPPEQSVPPSHPPAEEDSPTPPRAAGSQFQLPPNTSLHISFPGIDDICDPNMNTSLKVKIPQGQWPSAEEVEKKIPEVKLQELARTLDLYLHTYTVQKRSFQDNEDNSTTMNPPVFNGTSLKWVKFQGSIPDDAVCFRNTYADQDQYPACISSGHIGYYTPERGPYCFYPFADKEEQSSEFWLLVNENNLALLEWREDSMGDAPPNAVSTCSGGRFYVGKNKFGIGKVDRRETAFFVVVNGVERHYRWYDVLVIKKPQSDN